MRFKRGDINTDQFIFWAYRKNGDEYWVPKELFLYLKEKNKKSALKWQKKNKDKVNKRSKKWRDCNKESEKFREKKYRLNNPFSGSIKTAKRRTRLANSTLMLHRDQEAIIKTIYQTCVRLSKCLGIKHNVDHIHPISKGGYHIHTNMQILPARINFSKGSKVM